MNIPVYIHTANAALREAEYTVASLEEASRREPPGIYTVARTYRQNQTMLLDAHLDRLEESARLEGMSLSLNRAALREALRGVIQAGGYDESRFRITVPRSDPESIIIALEPLHLLRVDDLRSGVSVATLQIPRRNPRSKSNAWVPVRRQAQRQLPAHAYEGIIISEQGELIEGFSSNFYAVLDGRLYTADERILYGIARRVLLEVANGFLPITLRPVRLVEVPAIQEAFLTSSSRAIVPITRIDDEVIGDGAPGAVTLELAGRYSAWVDAHLEPI
jgi:branched-chain amino acid aminotransferase